jgi:hypothetical protein
VAAMLIATSDAVDPGALLVLGVFVLAFLAISAWALRDF